MRVAVAGGTGLMGRMVCAALEDGGHHPVPMSRSRGVDVVAGTGLEPAIDGADAVIDVMDIKSRKRAKATWAFTVATRNLTAVERRYGVRRHVLLSIVGVDDPRLNRMGYYRAKLAQERASQTGSVPVTVVRSTQWYEFAEQILSMAPLGPVGLVPRMLTQPVAARSVAALLVAQATGESADTMVEIAGPDRWWLPTMAARVLAHRGTRKRLLPIPMPGGGRGAAGGALLPGPDAVIDPVTLEQWLTNSSSGD